MMNYGERLASCWSALSDKACLGNDPDKWARNDANGLYTALRRTGADIHNTQGLAMALTFCAGRGHDGERAYRVLSRACLASLRIPVADGAQADLLAVLQAIDPDDYSLLMTLTDECAECCGLLTKLLSGAGARDEEESEEAEASADPEPAEQAPDGA